MFGEIKVISEPGISEFDSSNLDWYGENCH